MKNEQMKYKKSQIKMKDYEVLEDISQGKFSTVHQLEHKASKKILALKKFRKKDMIIQNCMHRISWELRILSNLNHPSFPRLHGTSQNKRYFHIVMDFIPGGDLFYWEKKIEDVSDKSSQFYMGQVVLMLEHLHDKNIVYRDLKPENLILSIDGYFRLVDFGSAICLPSKMTKTYSLTGTPEFMAPEMILKNGHTISVDFWALGILIYEFISKENPFYDTDPLESYTRIIKSQFKFPKNFSGSAKNLIRKLLVKDPRKRLGCFKTGIEDIKKHVFFSETNWEELAKKKTKPPFIPRLDSIRDTRYFSKYKVTMDDSEEIDPFDDPFILW